MTSSALKHHCHTLDFLVSGHCWVTDTVGPHHETVPSLESHYKVDESPTKLEGIQRMRANVLIRACDSRSTRHHQACFPSLSALMERLT